MSYRTLIYAEFIVHQCLVPPDEAQEPKKANVVGPVEWKAQD